MRLNPLRIRWLVLSVLVPIVILLGCGKNKRQENEEVPCVGKRVVVDDPLQKINEQVGGIKNVVLKRPREAFDYAGRIIDLALTLPTKGQQLDCLKRMEKAILEIPTAGLKCADRERAMDVIFELEEFQVMDGFFRVGEPPSERWKVYFNGYRRWAEEIAVAKEQLKGVPAESRMRDDLESVIRFVSANHRGHLKAFEYQFVRFGVDDYSKDEYDVIKKMLEDYLGRPLVTKEQIDEEIQGKNLLPEGMR